MKADTHNEDTIKWLVKMSASRANVTRMADIDRARVDDFLAQISVVAGVLVKQSPVHADVPDERVARARERRHDPDVQESTARTADCIA